MGEKVIRTLDFTKPHALGHRAFFLFLSRRIKFVIFLFGISYLALHYEGRTPGEYYPYVYLGVRILFLASAGYFTLVLVRTFFEYRRYTYRFTEEAFIVTEGYIVRNEMAVVYHQIQSVNIKRNPLERLLGVSQIVILMAGLEQATHHTRIILPAVGKTRARLVQKELLGRARKSVTPQFAVSPTQIA